MNAPTGFVASARFRAHESGVGHPEASARLDAIEARLELDGLLDELDVTEPRDIDLEHLRRVHDDDLVDRLERTRGKAFHSLDQDTHVGPRSFDAARLASGGLLDACERVLDGSWKNAFVCARPPGHHAEFERAMGFCLVNHVAVAARALQELHGLGRIAIVDWDVHHGNGTQHLFERDPSIYYASLHEWPLYPGSGARGERGVAKGEGTTLNLPQPPRATNSEWLRAFEGELLPALEEFDPEFVLVSAGFDGHADDPLATTRLDESAYATMTEGLWDVARRHASGRLVSLLEGGYDLDALGRSVSTHVTALLQAQP